MKDVHYCLMLLTNEFPTNTVIEKALEPYNSETWWRKYEETNDDSNRPLFTWDWWQVGGRYNGVLKLKMDREDETNDYRWMFFAREPRAGRLYRSYLLERMCELEKPIFGEDQYLRSMGAREGYIYVDGGKIADMLNFADEYTSCCYAIDQDGNAYAREYWNGSSWVDDPVFEDKIKAVCENKADGYVVFIDLHD